VSDFVVRRAEPADAEQLTRLAEAVSGEPEAWLISADGEWRSVGDERRYLKAVRRYAHAAVFVAQRKDGELVGRLSVARDAHPASSHVADLGLMVAQSARRQGVGWALLDAAVGWAREAGVRKLELHVFPWNEPAIRLYEKFGFEKEGYRKAHYRRAGEDVDAILMACAIVAHPSS
jgi:RimJ/RimL family protein N-acetyltransferase